MNIKNQLAIPKEKIKLERQHMDLKIGLSTIIIENRMEFKARMCSIPIGKNHDQFNPQIETGTKF